MGRELLKKIKFCGTKPRICLSMRELGSHINYANLLHNATLQKRVKGSKHMLQKLRFLPGSWQRRQVFVKGGSNRKAWWGAEATPVGKHLVNSLRLATVRAMRPKGDLKRMKRSVDLALNICSDTTADPGFALVKQRLFADRRWLLKADQSSVDVFSEVLSHDGPSKKAGLVTLLKSSLSEVGWRIDGDLNITTPHYSFSLLGTPIQPLDDLLVHDRQCKATKRAYQLRKNGSTSLCRLTLKPCIVPCQRFPLDIKVLLKLL